MPIVLDGTAGIDNNVTDLSYTGTLTGGTGVVNLGSGQVFKDASGNVGIGTSSPGAKLDIIGNARSSVAWILNNGTNELSVNMDRINYNTAQYYVLNQSSVGVVLNNGATSWAAQSDERTKDILEPIAGAVEKVVSLRAVIGKYKTDDEGTRRVFLIAQDVQAVLPEAVSAIDDEQGTLSLRYTDTIPLLVAAIQEQQAIIESLTARVVALEQA